MRLASIWSCLTALFDRISQGWGYLSLDSGGKGGGGGGGLVFHLHFDSQNEGVLRKQYWESMFADPRRRTTSSVATRKGVNIKCARPGLRAMTESYASNLKMPTAWVVLSLVDSVSEDSDRDEVCSMDNIVYPDPSLIQWKKGVKHGSPIKQSNRQPQLCAAWLVRLFRRLRHRIRTLHTHTTLIFKSIYFSIGRRLGRSCKGLAISYSNSKDLKLLLWCTRSSTCSCMTWSVHSFCYCGPPLPPPRPFSALLLDVRSVIVRRADGGGIERSPSPDSPPQANNRHPQTPELAPWSASLMLWGREEPELQGHQQDVNRSGRDAGWRPPLSAHVPRLSSRVLAPLQVALLSIVVHTILLPLRPAVTRSWGEPCERQLLLGVLFPPPVAHFSPPPPPPPPLSLLSFLPRLVSRPSTPDPDCNRVIFTEIKEPKHYSDVHHSLLSLLAMHTRNRGSILNCSSSWPMNFYYAYKDSRPLHFVFSLAVSLSKLSQSRSA